MKPVIETRQGQAPAKLSRGAFGVAWIEQRERLRAAQARHDDPSGAPRVLMNVWAARNHGSLLTSSYGRPIHPCKGCTFIAMPLCH